MTDTATATPSTAVEAFQHGDLDPATARHLAAQWREAQRLAMTAVVPKSITHTRAQVNGQWTDVPQPPEVVKATVFAVVRYGEIFGYPAAVALNKVDVVEGRLEPRYDALAGLMYEAGHQIRYPELSSERCTVKVRRFEDRNDPEGWQSITYTIEDARRAGLAKVNPNDRDKKSAWHLHPEDMLVSKALKRACRRFTPDVLIRREDADLLEGASVEQMVAPARTAGIDAPAITPAPEAQVEGETDSEPAADPDDDVVDAELVEHQEAPAEAEPEPDPSPVPAAPVAPPQVLLLSEPQSKKLHALLREKRGAVGPARHRVLEELLGHPVTSVSDLTVSEASAAIDALEAEPALPPAEDR